MSPTGREQPGRKIHSEKLREQHMGGHRERDARDANGPLRGHAERAQSDDGDERRRQHVTRAFKKDGLDDRSLRRRPSPDPVHEQASIAWIAAAASIS